MTIEERQEIEERLKRRYNRMLFSLNDYEIKVLDLLGTYTLEEEI